jgi:hypothetical protein
MEKKVLKMSVNDFKQYIISEAMKMLNAGDPMEVDMNSMDKLNTSDGAKVKVKENGNFESKTDAPKSGSENIEKQEDTVDVDMNQAPSKGGSDEKIAAAVSVEASNSTKKGDSVEGMHNAKFNSSDKQPSVESSVPFEEKNEKVDMNSMDKDVDEGAKTYVEAGAKDNTGQPDAKFSEEAKNEEEKKERIAKAIQLPESFKNKNEMIKFIKEEAKKISKLL